MFQVPKDNWRQRIEKKICLS